MRIRVTARDVRNTPKLDTFRKRLEDREEIPLLTGADLARLKPTLTVREAGDFARAFRTWVAVFFAGFYLLHLAWRVRGFGGDTGILPALHLLTGIGLILMVSLRDPLRDTMSLVPFAQGVAVGCAVMLALSFVDFGKKLAGYSFVPLVASLLLSAALIVLGSGPGLSDAKVNLWGMQPVEAIKILLVLFLAG